MSDENETLRANVVCPTDPADGEIHADAGKRRQGKETQLREKLKAQAACIEELRECEQLREQLRIDQA